MWKNSILFSTYLFDINSSSIPFHISLSFLFSPILNIFFYMHNLIVLPLSLIIWQQTSVHHKILQGICHNVNYLKQNSHHHRCQRQRRRHRFRRSHHHRLHCRAIIAIIIVVFAVVVIIVVLVIIIIFFSWSFFFIVFVNTIFSSFQKLGQ